MTAKVRKALTRLFALSEGRRADRRGQILVLFVLALVFVLIPGVGLGIDGARMFEERRAAQTAVDQAVTAAARESCVTGVQTNAVAKGNAAAAANGYNNGGLSAESGNTVAIGRPNPTPEPFLYEATIDARIPATFARMIPGGAFNSFHVTVTARAAGSNCGTASAGGPGTGPIYAGGADCGVSSFNNIEISGNLHLVDGLTHTNGNFKNGGSGSTFDNAPDPAVKYVGTFEGGSNAYLATPQGINAVPNPQWPAGWAPTDMPASGTDAFWEAYRSRRRNPDANASSFNVTSSGVWYTDTTSDLDVTGITAGLDIVIVSRRGPIKLPTDLSTSNLVGRNFNPFNDPGLPRQNVILLTGFSPSDGKPCDSFAIEKSGESGTFNGIIWAPRAMVRWSGNKATLNGCIVSHAFQMNGNEHRLNNNATLCAAGGSTGSPAITLVK